MLGTTRTEVQLISGKQIVEKRDEVYDLDIIEGIKRILQYPEVQEDLRRPRSFALAMVRSSEMHVHLHRNHAEPGYFADVQHGAGWLVHPKAGEVPLRLGLYTDACENAGVLGAHRGGQAKEQGIYLFLLQLSPALRLKSKYIINVCSRCIYL